MAAAITIAINTPILRYYEDYMRVSRESHSGTRKRLARTYNVCVYVLFFIMGSRAIHESAHHI